MNFAYQVQATFLSIYFLAIFCDSKFWFSKHKVQWFHWSLTKFHSFRKSEKGFFPKIIGFAVTESRKQGNDRTNEVKWTKSKLPFRIRQTKFCLIDDDIQIQIDKQHEGFREIEWNEDIINIIKNKRRQSPVTMKGYVVKVLLNGSASLEWNSSKMIEYNDK